MGGGSHFTVLTGVLGFIGKEFLQKPECAESALEFKQPQVVLLLAGLGILLSMYSLGFIRAYGNHVIRKWAIADQIRGMIPELGKAVVLEGDPSKNRKRRQWIPDLPDARLLMLLTAIYLLIFIVLAIIARLQMT